MLSRLLDALMPLPARNEIRLALGRHPKPLRQRYPALEWMRLGRKAVVIDVGAHVGDFTECVLAYRPHARVHAFEPLPDAFRILAGRTRRFPNVVAENVALGREAGRAELNVRAYGEASSFLENGEILRRGVYGLDFSTAAKISVPVITLDEYVRTRELPTIDLLKLDVQGFELEVLAGAERTLDRTVWIYTEAQFQELYRGGPLFTTTFEHLHHRGFELLEMTAFRADDDGRLMEADMVFRRKR